MNSRATIVAIVAFPTGGFGGFMLQSGYGRLEQIRIQNEGLREQVQILEKQIAVLEAERDEVRKVLEGKPGRSAASPKALRSAARWQSERR